jgi:hypothetical protein
MLRVFIGSSSESLEELDRVASWIESFNYTALPWNDLELFRPGKTVFDSLSNIARDVDAAIFIFSEDDKVWYRNDTSTQPRDNVLIEYGLFLGVLGTGRVIFCRKGNPRFATDLLGIMHVDISNQSAAKIKIRNWLRSVEESMKISPYHSTLERLNSPFQALGKQTLFLKGTELIRQSKHRVVLSARTPIPLVGARPYDDSNNPVDYEIEQFNTYINIARSSSLGVGPTFRCVAHLESLQDDIRTVNTPTFSKRVGEYLSSLYQLSSYSEQSKLQIRWYKINPSLTYLLADNDFIIWFKDKSGENVWITANNRPIADALYYLSDRDSVEISYTDIIHSLGLNV